MFRVVWLSARRVNVKTTDATTGATALLLPAQNTHTLDDHIRDPRSMRALAALRMVWASVCSSNLMNTHNT